MIRNLLMVGFAVLLAFTGNIAGQQTSDSKTRQGLPASSPIEGAYTTGIGLPSRRAQTRTESNGRELITEITETHDLDGGIRTSRETTTETVRSDDSIQTRQEVFEPDAQGKRRLVETTQIDVQTFNDGSSRRVANTMSADLNGHFGLSSREIQETRSLSPGVKQTDTSIYVPGINQPLSESERLQQTERQVSPTVTQSETTHFFRDGNGRWQATETRNEEGRNTEGERVAEETVRRISDNGTLTLSEKRVTRESRNNGQEETVTERYWQGTQRVSLNYPLELNERVRLTTSPTPDGGQQTIREVEGRNPIAPNEPLRIVERTVETSRQIGPDRWEIQRQVFFLDGNGRLAPVLIEKGESVGK